MVALDFVVCASAVVMMGACFWNCTDCCMRFVCAVCVCAWIVIGVYVVVFCMCVGVGVCVCVTESVLAIGIASMVCCLLI